MRQLRICLRASGHGHAKPRHRRLDRAMGSAFHEPLRSRGMVRFEQTTCFYGRSGWRTTATFSGTRIPTRRRLEQEGVRPKKRLSRIRLDALHIRSHGSEEVQLRWRPARSSSCRWRKAKGAEASALRLECVERWCPRSGINSYQSAPESRSLTFLTFFRQVGHDSGVGG